MAKWELYEQIGQGGYGQVFRARLTESGREVAIKRLVPHRTSTSYLASLKLEADTAARLAHPNIVKLLGVETDEQGHICLIFELVSGIDVARLLGAGHVPISAAVHIGRSMLAALAHVHENGRIVHRDISPQNVLISWEGEVKLSDFGLAKAIGNASISGRMRGKMLYMSPEQFHGTDVDGRSDLFSVGLVLYELLAGYSPYGHSEDTVVAFMNGLTELAPLADCCPEVPPALSAAVMRLVQRMPKDRFPSARAALDALPDWPHGQAKLASCARQLHVLQALERRPISTEGSKRRSHLAGVAAAAFLLGAGGVGAVWWLTGAASSPASPPRAITAPEPVRATEPARQPMPGPALLSEPADRLAPEPSPLERPGPASREPDEESTSPSTERKPYSAEESATSWRPAGQPSMLLRPLVE